MHVPPVGEFLSNMVWDEESSVGSNETRCSHRASTRRCQGFGIMWLYNLWINDLRVDLVVINNRDI